MADLIDRKAFMKWASKIPVHDLSDGRGLCRVIFAEDFLKALKDLPSAERHGHWIPVTNGRGGHECDICHNYASAWQTGEERLTNYCPNCGADMRGE